MALPVSQSRVSGGWFRKLRLAGTKGLFQTHYLRLVLVIGVMLLYSSYRGVARTGQLRASLRVPVEARSLDDVVIHSETERPPTSFSRCVDKDHIALTFDDGPNALTLALLDIFDKYDVQATFFFVGVNLELDKTTHIATKLTFDRGHQVASHLWNHPKMTGLDDQQIHDQLKQNSDALLKITGHRPRYMRPPYGATNDVVNSAIYTEAYKSVMWSCDSNDWRLTREADVTEFIDRCSLDGMVLLLHEGRQSTVEAVEKFIRRVRTEHPEKKFVRADECSGFLGDANVKL